MDQLEHRTVKAVGNNSLTGEVEGIFLLDLMHRDIIYLGILVLIGEPLY